MPRPPSSKSSSSSRFSPRLTNLYKAAMNRFLTKKRAKKVPEAPKVELDLSLALPSSDDFRTSLIMPKLSARFSMLKEQDDPNSKIGKASDDSVLAPRRQSRLPEFGYHHHGLADIAEVASINSFTRPPFAQGERGNSIVSDNGYGTDEDAANSGSVMSRKRPGEGNVLFGGRQKVYMISATGSDSNLAKNGMRGRALYEDDVNMSAFQKHRLEEKERLEAEAREQRSKLDDDGSPSKGPLYSPSLKRETSSSTATSSPSTGRTSTAATSVTSQSAAPLSASSQSSSPSFAPPSDRSTARGRRLYEQGLDRDIKEQQASSMTRLNSVQRPRAPTTGRTTPDPFPRAPSRTHDRFKGPNHAFRAQSPSPSPAYGQFQPYGNAYGNNHMYQIQDLSPSPPNSPPLTTSDHVLQAAIGPNDRGKATAMGAFNKPKQFSEKQYLERQMTLNQGRNTPTPGPEAPKQETSPKKGILRNGIEPPVAGRPRAMSTKDEFAPVAFNVFQRAANQLKSPGIASPLKEEKSSNFFASSSASDSDYEQEPEPEPEPEPRAPSRLAVKNGRFGGARIPVVSPDAAPPAHEHPAFRSQNIETQKPLDPPIIVHEKPLKTDYDGLEQKATKDEDEVDSPTLGPGGSGLSGLVRQHLRIGSNISDKSQTSIYPAVPPAAPISASVAPLALRTRDVSNAPTQNSESETPAHSSYSHSNPWDLEEFEGPYMGEVDSTGSASPVDGDRRNRPSTETTATATGEFRRPILSSRIPEDEPETSWEQELQKTHNRNTSTETTQERIAFQNDLAARQKAIQEKLKETIESQQRAASPTQGRSGPFRGLELLRTKSSRESMKGASQPKPMKVLGLGSSTNLIKEVPEMPTNGNGAYSERGYSSDYVRTDESRSNSRPPIPRSIPERVSPPQSSASHSGPMASRRDYMQRESGERQKDGKETTPQRRSPPESQRSSMRSRSNSEHSNGRSRSRTGRYKDDLDKAMAEGTSARTTIYPEPSPAIPAEYQSSSNPPVDVLAQYANQQVNRTNEYGRNNVLGIQTKQEPYFEQKGLFPPPPPVHAPNSIPSPRPSPGFIHPATGQALGLPANPRSPPTLSSPAFAPGSGRPSPLPSPFSVNSTPPISASSTPLVPVFPTSAAAPAGSIAGFRSASRTGTRKRSIQKHEISEPTLISTTSVIDTVDLPPEASLRNGMDEVSGQAGSALHPLRRRFGFGSREMEPPRPAYAAGEPAHSLSADEGDSKASFRPRHRLRKSSSDGAKIGMRLRAQQDALAMQSNPALGHFASPGVVEGAMF